jgi:hypothetical protein
LPWRCLILIGSFSETEQSLATSSEESANIILNRSELGVSATLALEVVEQGSECGKAFTAAFSGLIGAVIQRSLVGRAADVLLKSSGASELAMTDVALVARTVVSRAGIPGWVNGVAVVPFEQTFSNDAVGIMLTESTMNDSAGEVLGLGTGRTLEMVRNAAGSDEASLAERTRDWGALMDTASHVLSQVVGVLEVAITIGAVEMLVVSFCVLVVIACNLSTETHVASFTVVRPQTVIQSVHVL